MTPEGPYPAQTCAERKEALYRDIISLFDKGKVSATVFLREVGLQQTLSTVYVCILYSRKSHKLIISPNLATKW